MEKVDLAGRVLGNTVVLGPDEDTTRSRGMSYWFCKCGCGKVYSVRASRIKSCSSIQCNNCAKHIFITRAKERAIDLTGKRFGNLTVQSRVENSKHGAVQWHCICDCGGDRTVSTNGLLRENVTDCGCVKNLIGKRYGYATVIEKADIPSGQSNHDGWWKCLCDCGNEFVASTKNIKRTKWLSCGCKDSARCAAGPLGKYTDHTGERHGHLTVLKIDKEKTRYGKTYWICKCDCGNICSVSVSGITTGGTKSCGLCGHHSYGEEKIAKLLNEHKIRFEHEKTFAGCINHSSGYRLRFDFFVEGKYIIEFDGVQHFRESGGSWSRNYTLDERKRLDAEKNSWCFKMNIPIIRIPYTQLNQLCIQDLLPETSPFLLSKTDKE